MATKWRKAIPNDVRSDVLERAGGRCQYCGIRLNQGDADTRFNIDHIVPVSAGGTDEPGNLVAACRRCNFLKGKTPAEKFADRSRWFTLPSWLYQVRSRYRWHTPALAREIGVDLERVRAWMNGNGAPTQAEWDALERFVEERGAIWLPTKPDLEEVVEFVVHVRASARSEAEARVGREIPRAHQEETRDIRLPFCRADAGMTAHAYGIRVDSDRDPDIDLARWVDYDWADTYEDAARTLHDILKRVEREGRVPIFYEIIENQ